MKDYKSLLGKFWNGSASEMEKLQLYKIIMEEEEVVKIALQQEFEAEDGEHLQPEASKKILESLHKEIGARATKSIEMPRKSFGMFRWAAALLAIGFASFFTWKYYRMQDTIKDNNNFSATYEYIDNNGTGIRNVVLSDGTSIDLYPQSGLRFQQPFNQQHVRSIALKGKANFIVKHDAQKPFEVIANNIRTTDIGTEFCIDASDEHTFKVALKEGSIHVAAMPNSGFKMEDKILEPGEELRFDFLSKKMSLAHVSRKKESEDQHSKVIAKERLVFNKTPLNNVFSKLEARELIKIKFKEEEIKELTFTGTIEPTDNIQAALNIICNLNGLYYHKTKQGFIVAKNK
jgi:ferric-dicitrate binding protein FerR (iron transport regulator)